MNQVFLVYKTDVQHSYASRDIIGIATTHAIACFLCQYQAKKEGFKIPINSDQWHNLFNLKQTQGYKGEGEFQFEAVNTDILL